MVEGENIVRQRQTLSVFFWASRFNGRARALNLKFVIGEIFPLFSSTLSEAFFPPVICLLFTSACVIFWPSPGPKMPFKVMHRKEVTHFNGSYERKSRGRKLADEMGRAKNSHGTLIDWCTGREWPMNCITFISAWWRLNIRFQTSSGRSCGRWIII